MADSLSGPIDSATSARLPFWTNAALGGCAGVMVDSVLFPLDTIKTRLQKRGAVTSPASARSFYRGLLSAMAGSFPAAAIFWSTYEGAKAATASFAAPDSSLQGGARHAACAAAADVTVASFRTPFEVVKQQMQAGMHASTGGAVRAILKSEGPGGLYAGYLSTIARDVPFSAIQFALYEDLKRRLAEAQGRELVAWENGALGAVAGGVAAALTTPLDVIKTRLMTQPVSGAAAAVGAAPPPPRYAGWADALRTILREEGGGALLSGLGPRVAWISIGGAVFLGSYEELKRWATPAPAPAAGGDGEAPAGRAA